jgi:hypothetical protein
MTTAQRVQERNLLYTHEEIRLPEVPAAKSRSCFTGPIWKNRAKGFDCGLPVMQPATEPCTVTVLAHNRDCTFAELFARVFCRSKRTPMHEFARAMVEADYTLTLPQGEMVSELKRWSEPWASASRMFFTPTGDRKDPLAVRIAGCQHGQWYVTGELSLETQVKWPGVTVFLFKNFDVTRTQLRVVPRKVSP